LTNAHGTLRFQVNTLSEIGRHRCPNYFTPAIAHDFVRVEKPAGIRYLLAMADLRVEADRVLEVTDDLRALRTRLAELDAERAEVERKIEARLAQIGTTSPSDASEPRSAADHVFAYLRLHPNTICTAADIAREWKVRSERDINNIRTALWRLHAKKKIARISFGRYALQSHPAR
jgi:beta-phosphoglucomutase-like phosphatase (HAD superfamily)